MTKSLTERELHRAIVHAYLTTMTGFEKALRRLSPDVDPRPECFERTHAQVLSLVEELAKLSPAELENEKRCSLYRVSNALVTMHEADLEEACWYEAKHFEHAYALHYYTGCFPEYNEDGSWARYEDYVPKGYVPKKSNETSKGHPLSSKMTF